MSERPTDQKNLVADLPDNQETANRPHQPNHIHSQRKSSHFAQHGKGVARYEAVAVVSQRNMTIALDQKEQG